MQSTTLRTIPAFRALAPRSFVRTAAVNASLNASEETQHLKPWTEIPGPSRLPIIGQFHNFVPMLGGKFTDPNIILKQMYEMYGPISRLDGLVGLSKPMVLLYDAEAISQILRGENTVPIRPGFHSLQYYRKYHKKTKEQSLKPTGLITDQGEKWRGFRTAVNPVMLQPKTIRLYRGVLEEVADDMIARMRSIRDENGMLKGKFDVEMNLWALESIGVVALGARLNCFDPNLAEDSPERRLIQCVHDLFVIGNKLDFTPSLWRFYATKTFKEAMKLYEEQENLAKYFITKARAEIEKQQHIKKTDDEKPILEKLLQINEDVAVIMASDMLFAGVDTSANTMTALFYLLAKNPDKQKKLRDELKNSDDPGRYLKACVKESLRMHPVASSNIRQVTKDYGVLGYKIPKDMYVIFNHQVLSSLEEQFPRSQEFIPERWIDKDSPVYYTSAHPFSFNPFGFGVRMCIGRRIAELEIETFLAKVVQNFQIDFHGPLEPLKFKVEALNYITGPFNLTFKDL